MKNNWKVKESLNSWVFWVLLNLIIAEMFYFLIPITAIPNIIGVIYFLITGPKQEKRIKEIQDEIDRLDQLEEKLKDEGKK